MNDREQEKKEEQAKEQASNKGEYNPILSI